MSSAEAFEIPAATAGAVSSQVSNPTDIVDEWGRDSFPASDPPANW